MTGCFVLRFFPAEVSALEWIVFSRFIYYYAKGVFSCQAVGRFAQTGQYAFSQHNGSVRDGIDVPGQNIGQLCLRLRQEL
jgi:hypothetical protein